MLRFFFPLLPSFLICNTYFTSTPSIGRSLLCFYNTNVIILCSAHPTRLVSGAELPQDEALNVTVTYVCPRWHLRGLLEYLPNSKSNTKHGGRQIAWTQSQHDLYTPIGHVNWFTIWIDIQGKSQDVANFHDLDSRTAVPCGTFLNSLITLWFSVFGVWEGQCQ